MLFFIIIIINVTKQVFNFRPQKIFSSIKNWDFNISIDIEIF